MIRKSFREISARDLWMVIAPVVIALVLALVFAWQFVEPGPPDRLVMTTGAVDSGYHMFAQRYKEILARDGVTVDLRTSAGSQENVSRLLDEQSNVEVGFFQGGSAFAANAPHLRSLGSIYYEPLWVFYRGAEILDFGGLKGKRLAIGPEESGTRALALQLLAVNATVMPPTALLPESGLKANEMLLQGQLDAVFMVGPPESPLVEQLISARGIRLLSLERAEAYTRRFPYLTRLTLPRGVFDFVSNIPAQDVILVSPTANLLVRDTLHPALAFLLMRAAKEIHGNAGLLNKIGEFPAPLNSEFPLTSEAERYYTAGPPFLQRYLPYWIAVMVDRLWIILLPALALLVPVSRIIPPLYRWRVRSRIYRWYARLKELELELDDDPSPEKAKEFLERLDQIEEAVNRVNTPLAYSDNLYAFRQNVNLVRQRVRAKFGLERRSRVAERSKDEILSKE
ncbi:MAG TPA: TAXI family TRAP transporter solute-binding subunit [Burkholderiales bacterium]|jgi:TRAP transporter TAXI family solute receptor|nr:TAXI family TRAP transporter solute-binding subunit [Burkholderiales bacterium]